MKWNVKYLIISLVYLLLGEFMYAQEKDTKHALGASVGITFGGPMSKMVTHLENNNFDYYSNGGWFGPISYPVKSGPRGEFSLSYILMGSNSKDIEFSFTYAELGEVAGSTGQGHRIELGFRNYALGVFYQFGPRLTKFSVGPTLMLNQVYAVEFMDYKESNKIIDDKITAGLKGTALIYFWNRRVTYGNIGISYLLTLPTEHGPFPVNDSENELAELEKTKLNFGYGTVFFAFGVKF
ncbi:hypothetical protein [Flagellimonas zhangzhouensis]|uniref:Uncharacterized protein n=1 Tax=Flagellimonas zhangzhouensis TaxID=1073328 RepID=A0A1H2Z1S2_9FLAO|nr:hypothetical protein [Allomuricauda zhangzhouensis]SDR03675.1 hypothetical protein SAMN05216294_3199 [Allomuricauda zhangzhouensis]SDX11257.1 hypothetical protein SAMN04487892_3294 [Allomuricauda zhangzhouensis]